MAGSAEPARDLQRGRGARARGVPVLVAIFLLICEVRRRFRERSDDETYWIRVGATTGLVAIALQEFVEFSLQMPGNAVLLTVLAAIAIHRPPPRHQSTISSEDGLHY